LSSTNGTGVEVTQEQGPAHAAVPSVTVIVPTYNRAAVLADTLGDLIAQDYPADRLELIVVDNSSTDNTEDVVQTAAARSPFPVRYFRKDNRGPAVSRNYGAARACGEVLAFTDSDCRVPPTWVRSGVRCMKPGVGLVAGPILPVVNDGRRPGFFQHQVPVIDEQHLRHVFPTANIFYRREAFDLVGGFNEEFGTYPFGIPVGGEDTDLAWRVKRAGYAAAFAADAPVYHEATDVTAIAWLFEPIKLQILPRLVREIPELREGYWNRYIADPRVLYFYLAAAGCVAAGARRQALPLALALPWLWNMRGPVMDDLRAPRRWWRVPVKYALMFERCALQSATLLYASIRHRALVL
jgi:glycosyltransferase involved in cell wall biosynthesis